MNNNKSITKNLIVIIQISILIIGILAFTNIVSAQISSSPLPTSVVRKVVISNPTIQESESGGATITGKPIIGFGGPPSTPVVDPSLPAKLGRLAKEGVKKFFEGVTLKKAILSSGLFWAGIAFVGALLLVAGITGGDWDEALFWAKAAGSAVGGGIFVKKFAGAFFSSSPIGWGLGGLTALMILYGMTRKTDQRVVMFDCKLWQSQTGGGDCKQCNYGEFPCTEYKCMTLGQACELKNEGDDAECIHKDPLDVASPQITEREDSLLSEDYSYYPIPATNGVEILYNEHGDQNNGGCLPSYKSFTYGIELDKTGLCKMADHSTANFSDMELPFGSGLWKRNQTQVMFFPGKADLEAEGHELPTGGNYEFYVRCESVNGYANVEEFLFKFCIDPDDDTSQPFIQGFNLLDRTPIRWFSETDLHETDVKIYVEEPLFAETGGCKWSRTDQDYEDMKEEMTSCGNNIFNDFTTFNAQLSFSCSATLTGLQNAQENKFYFRCKDKAENVNTQSKVLTLIGSRPLAIDSVGPEGIIKGSSNEVKVTLTAKTSAGYEDGKADCYYSSTGNYNDYTIFVDTRSYQHSSEMYLPGDDYTYYIQCFDMAGNVDTKTIEFEVETDFRPPLVVRAYYDGGDLNLITNEPADCVYDTEYVSSPCDYAFEDGISMSSADDLTHSVVWNTNNNLYIKCQDEYGNQPAGCSIILRPFEFF